MIKWIKTQTKKIVRMISRWPVVGRFVRIGLVLVRLPELRASYLKTIRRQEFFETKQLPALLQTLSDLNHRQLVFANALNSLDKIPFDKSKNTSHRLVVLVSRDFPPNHNGGIATFKKDLAEALAVQGHIVHVITQSPDINRVDFEHGVWVHRVVNQKKERPFEALERKIPENIWDWSATAFKEAQRIATHRPIDVVEAPIWDCEGIAFLLKGQWPLVTSLQTTRHFWLDAYPELRHDQNWMETFGRPVLAVEKELMIHSHAIRSISGAIRHDIEHAYGFSFDEKRIFIAPLGMSAKKHISLMPKMASDMITILFVGRLEHRKGIDVLLEAIPRVLEKNSHVKFRILGNHKEPIPGEKVTYPEKYFPKSKEHLWSHHVQFEGRVDDHALVAAYKNCDIFVVPSRFESFGLVFLEAMREGKPVIGSLIGGIPEVVSHDVNGLLVPPEDVEALTRAILRLVESPELRTTMGNAGQKIFLEKFTSEHMAQASEKLYDLAQKNFNEHSL